MEIIKKFNIGYSDNKNILCSIIKNNYDIFIMNKIGMFIKKNNIYIDRFLNRIIFPIYDIKGNIIAFGGRILQFNKDSKYMNTPDNIIFKKKENIYGLYQVIKSSYNINKLLVVEGYTDVITLHRYDINYAVSILGTNLTNNHINILLKFSNNIIFCYDGDKTGYLSLINTFKKILLYITDDRKINFIVLNNNFDPDNLIRKIGKKKFENILKEKSLDISEFLFSYILKIKNNKLYTKIRFIRTILKFINKIPGKLTKIFLKKKIVEKFNLNYYLKYNTLNNKKYFQNQNIINSYNIITLGLKMLIEYPFLYKFIKIPKIIKITNNKDFIYFIKITFICYKYNIKNKNILYEYLKKNIDINYINNLKNINTNFKYMKKVNFFLYILNSIYIFIIKNLQENFINNNRNKKIDFYNRKKFLLLNNEFHKLINNKIKI